MRPRLFYPAIAVIGALSASPAAAQTCFGAASFSTGAWQAGGSITFSDGAKAYAGGLIYGTPAGVFGGVTVSTLDIEDESESPRSVGATVGYQVPLGTTGKAQFCPVATFVKQLKLDIDEDISASGRTIGVGGSLGVVASSSASLDFVPFASLLAASSKFTLEGFGLEASESESYGSLTLGSGFIFNKNVTVQPRVVIPIGLEDAETSYGVAIAINFGSRAQSSRRAR